MQLWTLHRQSLSSSARAAIHWRERAERRGVAVAIYTSEMFTTGNDQANRAAVRAVPTAELDLVGIALRATHRDADAVLRGVTRHG
jgi:hypothetical protein